MINSQNAKILKHLRTKGSITQMQALTLYGCMRLGARIYDLKMSGQPIIADMINILNRNNKVVRVAKYRLDKNGNNK